MPASSWTLAPALIQLRSEIDDVWPGRDRTSDGTLGDLAHSARASDHNPDSRGVVHAIDIDEDLAGRSGSYPYQQAGRGADLLFRWLLARCRSGAEKRVKYLIYERRIYSRTYGWREQVYSGVNAHSHHLHISCVSGALGRSTAVWGVAQAVRPPVAAGARPKTMTIRGKSYLYLARVTVRGINAARIGRYLSRHVFYLQRWLTVLGLYAGDVDGRWTPATQAALDRFRRDRLHLKGADAGGSIGLTSLTAIHQAAKATKKIGK